MMKNVVTRLAVFVLSLMAMQSDAAITTLPDPFLNYNGWKLTLYDDPEAPSVVCDAVFSSTDKTLIGIALKAVRGGTVEQDVFRVTLMDISRDFGNKPLNISIIMGPLTYGSVTAYAEKENIHLYLSMSDLERYVIEGGNTINLSGDVNFEITTPLAAGLFNKLNQCARDAT